MLSPFGTSRLRRGCWLQREAWIHGFTWRLPLQLNREILEKMVSPQIFALNWIAWIVFLVAVVRSSRKTKLQDLRLWICGGKGWWILDTNRWEEWSGWFWCSLGNYQVVVDFHLCLAVDDASSWYIIRMGWNCRTAPNATTYKRLLFMNYLILFGKVIERLTVKALNSPRIWGACWHETWT